MLHLQEEVKYGSQNKTIVLSERLPNFITAPCHLNVTYQIEVNDDFYLINLHVTGELSLHCQRCLDEFKFPYDNTTVVAVCRNEERAEQILEHYECIVSANLHVSLEEVLIDELHLYAPQFHAQISDCRSEINQILMGKK